MKTALLVIDIQKDYFEGGKYPLVNPLDAAKNAYMLLQCFREHDGQHVHIQHISLKPDAAFFIKGDSGSDIHDSVAHFEGEPIVYKHYPNSFRETNLLEMLKAWGSRTRGHLRHDDPHVRGCDCPRRRRSWVSSHRG